MSSRLELTPPSATLALDEPPVNVLSIEAIGALRRSVGEVATRPEIAVLVLTAPAGRPFSAGVEVRDHLPERLDEMLDVFHGLCEELMDLSAVTVAAVNGPALGGGMELAACCDFILASANASFRHPEVDLGCFPPLGAAIYPGLLGTRRASEIVLLGGPVSAGEAKEIGFVNRVVGETELEAAVGDLVARLSEKSPAVLRLAKRALRLGRERGFDSLGEIEAIYREELAATEDMVEGLQAFLDKRKPIWKGK